MKTRSSPLLGLAAAGVLAMLFAPRVDAGDKEFGRVVQHIESHYHVRRSHGFLLGFVGLVVAVGHPYGVHSLKMALFTNHDFVTGAEDEDFSSTVQGALSRDWRPVVRVWSRRNGERTYIYAADCGPNDKYLRLLVVTLDQGDAVVLRLKVKPDQLAQMIDEPDCRAGLVNHRRRSAEVREAWR